MVSATQKSKQNKATRKLQASPAQMPIKARKLKRPGPALEEMLRAVDLVPPTVELPEKLVENVFAGSTVLLEAISKLKAPKLEEHLVRVMNRPEEWREDPADWAAYLEEQPDLVEFLQRRPNKLTNLELARQACQVNAVRFEYGLIRSARDSLRELARGVFFPRIITTTLLLDTDEDHKALVMYEPFVAAIRGEQVDYIHECANSSCRRIFFAGRKNQACCQLRCAKKVRQERWKDKYKAGNERYYH